MGVAVCQWNVIYETGSQPMAVVCGPPSPPPYLQPSPKEGWSYICFPPNSPSFSTESYTSWENQAKLDDWLPYQKDEATLVKNKYLWNEWRGRVWGTPIKVASPDNVYNIKCQLQKICWDYRCIRKFWKESLVHYLVLLVQGKFVLQN